MNLLKADEWFCADLHLGHEGILKYRPQFASIEEHDEYVIERINEKVKPRDKLYIFGDLTNNRKPVQTARRLNGRKRLVKGNHDKFHDKYEDIFEYTSAVCLKNGFVGTHIPIHPSCLDRWTANVHGHLHGRMIYDPRYLCISLEQTDYRPLHYEEVMDRLDKQKEKSWFSYLKLRLTHHLAR